MDQESQRERRAEVEGIKIDYDNIDVADIMSQIRSRIALQPRESLEDVEGPGPWDPAAAAEFGMKARLKGFLLRFMKPFFPLIKLMVFPVHQELRETIVKLDLTNKRLDKMIAREVEYIKLLHNLSHNLVVELTKLKIEHETLKVKTRIMEKDFELLKRKEKILEEEIFR